MKVGVVIVSHGRLGEEMLRATQLIVTDAPPFLAVGIEPELRADEIRASIAKALDAADSGDGVLVLTDMFGGTPSNVSLSFLGERAVEVVTGLNLPMLIKLATLREEKSLDALAAFIKQYGQRNISRATEILPDAGQ
jgi:PTS system mannose-specific IIA component